MAKRLTYKDIEKEYKKLEKEIWEKYYSPNRPLNKKYDLSDWNPIFKKLYTRYYNLKKEYYKRLKIKKQRELKKKKLGYN